MRKEVKDMADEALAKIMSKKKETDEIVKGRREDILKAYETMKEEASNAVVEAVKSHVQDILIANTETVFAAIDSPVKATFMEADKMLRKIGDDLVGLLDGRARSELSAIFATYPAPTG